MPAAWGLGVRVGCHCAPEVHDKGGNSMATGQNPKPRTGSPGPGSLLRDPTPSTMSNPPVVGLGGWWWCRDGRGRTCKVPENAASGARGREETLWAACASLRSGSSRLTTAHGLALRERGGLAALLYGGATCASFWFPVSPPRRRLPLDVNGPPEGFPSSSPARGMSLLDLFRGFFGFSGPRR